MARKQAANPKRGGGRGWGFTRCHPKLGISPQCSQQARHGINTRVDEILPESTVKESAFDPYFETARAQFEQERTKRIKSLVKLATKGYIYEDRVWAMNQLKALVEKKFTMDDMKSL